MRGARGGWQIEPDAGDVAAYAVFGTDRAWTGYAIADLEPPFRAYTRVALAWRGDEPPSAACLVLRHPEFHVIVPHGDPEGVAAIVAATELPETAMLSVRTEHRPLLERYYDVTGAWHEMERMVVTPETFRPPSGDSPAVERLGPSDLEALLHLYREYPESAFVPDHLRSGVFYGVRSVATLVAAGGTHAVARRAGIAAVGNIFTRPAARGRGYGTAITAAVVSELIALPCRDIILNVAVANVTARAIYARLGFRSHCRFWEAQARRR